MSNLVIAKFSGDVKQNCGWAQSIHCVNVDDDGVVTDFDLTPFASYTFQVRPSAQYTATPLASGTVTVVNAAGGLLVVGLSAKATGALPSTGATFEQTTPVWAEINGILTADPHNPVCLGQATLQVIPGGNAQQATDTAPTVPLQTINLVVGAVSAAAARQMIGSASLDVDGLHKASEYRPATATAPGAMSARQATQLLPPVANNFDPTVTDYTALSTGYTPIIGSVVGTIDGTKAWGKYGTGTFQWAPMHSVAGTFGASIQTWDTTVLVPDLACDTLGRVKLSIDGYVSGADTQIFLRKNGATASTSRALYTINGGFTGLPTWSANSSELGFWLGSWFTLVIDLWSPRAGMKGQSLSWKIVVSTTGHPGADPTIFSGDMVLTGTLPTSEIHSLGIAANTGRLFDASCVATIERY